MTAAATIAATMANSENYRFSIISAQSSPCKDNYRKTINIELISDAEPTANAEPITDAGLIANADPIADAEPTARFFTKYCNIFPNLHVLFIEHAHKAQNAERREPLAKHTSREESSNPLRTPFEVDIERAIDAWSDDVFRLALRRTGSKTDAEDVLQNVFMKLLSAKSSITSSDHLKAWLLRATINSSNDVLRKRGKNISLDGYEAMQEYGFTEEELALHAAIDSLSQAQRTAVHLFYFEGYKTAEIAYITGENPSTVRSRLHRARKELKIHFEDGDIDE